MNKFEIFAQPWWVNLFIIVPFVAYYLWRRDGLKISNSVLIFSAVFGIAFGFVEAAAVIYLRAAVSILPEYGGALSDVAEFSNSVYQQTQILAELPKNLFMAEFIREAATMIMLISAALLAVRSLRERWAIFLWTFAIWDIFYYISLWATVGWPSSLLDPDVLFLIPVPWLSQVWFPMLVSALALIAVFITKKSD